MKEVQHATMTIRVALPVDETASEKERKTAICRALRLSSFSNDLELRPGLGRNLVDLTYTETAQEAAERAAGEAEAKAEAKLDRQRERYFDRNGHF